MRAYNPLMGVYQNNFGMTAPVTREYSHVNFVGFKVAYSAFVRGRAHSALIVPV